MKNKYTIIVSIALVLIGGGFFYKNIVSPKQEPTKEPVVSGKTREITITAKKGEYRFEPELIEAEVGDKIIATIINEDEFDHGLEIGAFGVSQEMPALSTTKVEFTVTKEGEFPFRCNVPCGQAVVNGEKRSHMSMFGVINVKSTSQY